MKKILIYICLIFLGTTFMANIIHAQDKNETVTSKEMHNGVSIDPKLNPDEKALILIAGQDNPAKAKAAIDPKLSPEEQALILIAGNDNPAKPEPMVPDNKDQVNLESLQSQQKVEAETSDNSQAVGQTPSSITNYRKFNGANSQPKGEQPDNITNYRNMNGVNSQPAGKKPEKR